MAVAELTFVVSFVALMSQSISPPYKVTEKTNEEVYCLAQNIYHEARGESILGMAGVALVTRNRVNSEYYPSSYCEVIHQSFTYHIAPNSEKHKALKKIKAGKIPLKTAWITKYFVNHKMITKNWPPMLTGKGDNALYTLNQKETWDTKIPIKNKCQFSWWCDGKSDEIELVDKKGNLIEQNVTSWKNSVEIAGLVLMGFLDDFTGGATHYYNPALVFDKKGNRILPKWARDKSRFKPSPEFKNGMLENHRYMIALRELRKNK